MSRCNSVQEPEARTHDNESNIPLNSFNRYWNLASQHQLGPFHFFNLFLLSNISNVHLLKDFQNYGCLQDKVVSHSVSPKMDISNTLLISLRN